MFARMALSMSTWSMKYALICGICILALWLLCANLLSFVSGSPINESYATAYATLFGSFVFWLLAAWIYGRQAGGEVLLDSGPILVRGRSIFSGVGFLIIGLATLVTPLVTSKMYPSAHTQGISPHWGLTVGILSLALYCFILASGRLQIRGTGIWLYFCLLQWNKIDTYRWADGGTLLLEIKGMLPFFHQGVLPIPPEQKEAVEQLLETHCGKAARQFTLTNNADASSLVHYLNDEE